MKTLQDFLIDISKRNFFEIFTSIWKPKNKSMKKIYLIVACMPFLLAMTCDDDNQVICTQEAKAGLNITVKDAVTNVILSTGVTVTAQDGMYTETLEVLDGDDSAVFIGAWERQGTYIVTVSKEGYQTFISSPIQVTADECHVIPQLLNVALQPN